MEIKDGGVLLFDSCGQQKLIPADTVVLALGMTSIDELSDALRDKVPEVYVIGDCAEPRKVKDAIWEGFRTARLI